MHYEISILILIVTFLQAFSPTYAECPSHLPVPACVDIPCNVTSCPCFPEASCSNDYCGGCNAKFDVKGIEVTNNCHLCVPDKVRLLGGTNNDGIVEIFVSGAWEKLCTAWKFSDNDAALICKELGFKNGKSLSLAAYGPMSGKYSAPLYNCIDGLESILDCSFMQNSTMCLHQNTFYASVVCFNETKNPEVTYALENDFNETHYGRVKLYRRGIWGQVCAEFWSDLDAAVFCHQMGFTGGYALNYRSTTGVPFVMTGINCNGSESNIEQCETQTQICYDSYRAGVLCYMSEDASVNPLVEEVNELKNGLSRTIIKPIPNLTISGFIGDVHLVRLSLSIKDGGRTYGRIEVIFDGTEGSICNEDWTDEDGDIVCRQLGFESGTRYYDTLPPGTGEVYLNHLKCSPYEETLLMCDSSGWKNITNPKCLDHSKDAGVYCYDNVRLSGGSASDKISMGRVEVYQKIHSSGVGYWTTLCAEEFDQADADVVCRQLQYHRAKILSPGIFGRLIYSTYTTQINCSGNEEKLLDCPHAKGSYCTNHEYASVLCILDEVIDDFRIYIENEDSGEIIVEQYGARGTICRQGWDDNDASVVCRSFGYKGGRVFGTTQSYARYDPIWLTEVDCNGTESSINDCKVQMDVPVECGLDYSSAGAICYNSTGLQTRIVDGSSHTGRIEVSRDGQWGTICDNSWSTYDARVACRELGFADGISYRRSYHGAGSGPIFLDNMQCDGTEESIFACSNRGWNRSSSMCKGHSKDAGVYCYRWVILSQSSTLYGSVNIWRENVQYGHVCSDGFDNVDAEVVCKEMGNNLGISLCCSSFGPSELPYVMADVRCRGNETSIRKCQHQSENVMCPSNTYASVVCSSLSSVPPGGWLVTSRISNSGLGFGYVQVNYFSKLGYICSEGFDDKDAHVICKENHFVTGYAYKHNISLNFYSHNVRWLSNMTCDGSESSLSQCNNLNWGQTGLCSHFSSAGVFCVHSTDITGIEVRLTNGTTVEGRVEVKTESLWQSLCSDTLTNKEASVLCRSQGFLDGVLLEPGKHGNGPYYVKIKGMNCTGSEKRVAECILDTSRFDVSCKHGAAAVKCYTTVRLTGSDIPEYGRLEMFNGTGWDAVCDDGFDDNDANVVCRYLGYTAGKYQCCSRLGVIPPTTRIAITKFGCHGGESKPQDCVFVNGSCSTGHYVSVLCISIFRGEDLSIRLPLNSFYGPVEVRRFGLWGYVCDNNWTNNEAKVVCKQLGFNSGYAISTKIDDRVPIIIGNVNCFGSEADFDHCRRTTFGEDHGCFARKTVAGVICSHSAVGGIMFPNEDYTLAKVVVDNSSLIVDTTNFENVDAKVFCKSMLFAGGTTTLYGGRFDVSVLDVSCDGSETSFLQCKAFWDPRKASKNMPAAVKCHKDVRLNSGGTFYGIVEVFKNDMWGTICNQGFQETEAGITCRDLGFEKGIPLCCAPFGYISSPHVVTDVHCIGTESKFSNCGLNWVSDMTSTSSVCDVPWDYSSVVCYNGIRNNDYTLKIAGNTYTGEIILTYLKVPGRICSDDWDDKDANVVCIELGYKQGVAYNHFVEEGPRSHGPYWTSGVKCKGTESKIGHCLMTMFGQVNECKAKHYAGVVCYNDEGLFYRLTGGDGRYGRVEIYLFDRWGSICDTHWDRREAHVYCKQINYATGDPYYGSYTSPGPVLAYETQFECTGNEVDLNGCPHGRWTEATSSRCLHHENDAGVFCYKSVKLHSGIGRETSEGAVLFYKYEQWNLVCNDGFTDNSAKVVCKELGFLDGRAKCCSLYGKLQWKLLSNHTVKCNGDEPDAATCAKVEDCTSQSYASVTCYDYVLPPTSAPATSTTTGTTQVTEKSSEGTGRVYADNTPTIVGVVIAVLVVIVIIVIIIVAVKCRRSPASAQKHERFHDDILEHAHDGSVRVQNPLHEISHEDTDQLTIRAGGTVSYLPATDTADTAAFSNPVYSKAEPIKSVINVIKEPSIPEAEHDYARLRLDTNDTTPIYDNRAEVEGQETTHYDNNAMRLSLAETAEIHSPDHTMTQPNWPTDLQSDDADKRTEL